MSIIITGLEMPKERENFNLTIKYNGMVLDTETGMQVAEAYEIPPHGRLIDADELMAMVHRAMEDDDMYEDDYRDVRDWLAVAPTVIEEEGDNI